MIIPIRCGMLDGMSHTGSQIGENSLIQNITSTCPPTKHPQSIVHFLLSLMDWIFKVILFLNFTLNSNAFLDKRIQQILVYAKSTSDIRIHFT